MSAARQGSADTRVIRDDPERSVLYECYRQPLSEAGAGHTRWPSISTTDRLGRPKRRRHSFNHSASSGASL